MISFGLDCNPIAHWQHVSALMLTQFPLAGHTSPLAAAVASNSSSVATPQCIKLCCLQNEMCEIRKQELLGIMQEQQAATHLHLKQQRHLKRPPTATELGTHSQRAPSSRRLTTKLDGHHSDAATGGSGAAAEDSHGGLGECRFPRAPWTVTATNNPSVPPQAQHAATAAAATGLCCCINESNIGNSVAINHNHHHHPAAAAGGAAAAAAATKAAAAAATRTKDQHHSTAAAAAATKAAAAAATTAAAAATTKSYSKEESGRQPQPNLGRIPNVHHLQGGSQQN